MRYPKNEEGEFYGMPKGEEAPEDTQPDLEKVNEQRLAAASLDVETRKKALDPVGKAESKKVSKKKK